MKLKRIFRQVTGWYSQTPERALNQAYQAALKIKELEEKHFQGEKISLESSQYGQNVLAYFQDEVKGYLQTIKLRLVEFKSSRSLLNLLPSSSSNSPLEDKYIYSQQDLDSSNFLERLTFIDEILTKYNNLNISDSDISEKNSSQSETITNISDSNYHNSPVLEPVIPPNKKKTPPLASDLLDSPRQEQKKRLDSATDKTGVLPRSFLNTINRIKQEIDPNSTETEEAVLKKFRTSRYKTAISIKFVLLLIIVPLLTHQLTKTFFLSPLVEKYFNQHEQIVFINNDLEEEAFRELQHYEETLHFKGMIGLIPKLSEEELEAEIKHKAEEISEEYRHRGTNAIANVFADIFSLITFGIVIATSRREIEIVKGFLDGILYSLSDSAKAFLIILFTDMFVGFHSPHGWEIILEGIARHFGLPENREFNFLFIATFPVILDTVLKYWIFRYLNRISPSAVATYRNMNE